MQQLKPSNTTVAAVIATAVVCFCIFMAFRNLLAPTELEQDIKYIKERAALEEEAEQLQHQVQLFEDSTTALLDSIAVLNELPTQINREHEAIRNDNWLLPADSASALLRARLAAEDTHRVRFVYRTYTD